MLTINAIADAMQDVPATNGWDAVLALNLKQVNTLIFQQYLQEGPASFAIRLRLILSTEDGTTFWILDAVLGPPEVVFQADASSPRWRWPWSAAR